MHVFSETDHKWIPEEQSLIGRLRKHIPTALLVGSIIAAGAVVKTGNDRGEAMLKTQEYQDLVSRFLQWERGNVQRTYNQGTPVITYGWGIFAERDVYLQKNCLFSDGAWLKRGAREEFQDKTQCFTFKDINSMK